MSQASFRILPWPRRSYAVTRVTGACGRVLVVTIPRKSLRCLQLTPPRRSYKQRWPLCLRSFAPLLAHHSRWLNTAHHPDVVDDDIQSAVLARFLDPTSDPTLPPVRHLARPTFCPFCPGYLSLSHSPSCLLSSIAFTHFLFYFSSRLHVRFQSYLPPSMSQDAPSKPSWTN